MVGNHRAQELTIADTGLMSDDQKAYNGHNYRSARSHYRQIDDIALRTSVRCLSERQ